MGASGCKVITEEGTEWVRTTGGHNLLAQLEALAARPEHYIAAFMSQLDPAARRLLQEELPELPAGTLDIIVSSWRLATAAGKQFAVRSEAPSSPLGYARASRVRVAVESDEAGVTVSIAHVPHHHSAWYQAGDRVREVLAAAG